MFTGLISHRLPLAALERQGSGLRMAFENPWLDGADPVARGESIAVSGVCLTALDPIGPRLAFDLSAETLERTWFRDAAPGRALNLERSVRLSDRLGGHLVSGHVDGIGRLIAIDDAGDGGRRLTIQADAIARYLVHKGSVALDGVSLTVIEPRAGRFEVAVIPATLAATSLGDARIGQALHLEADMIGKWVEKLVPEAFRAR